MERRRTNLCKALFLPRARRSRTNSFSDRDLLDWWNPRQVDALLRTPGLSVRDWTGSRELCIVPSRAEKAKRRKRELSKSQFTRFPLVAFLIPPLSSLFNSPWSPSHPAAWIPPLRSFLHRRSSNLHQHLPSRSSFQPLLLPTTKPAVPSLPSLGWERRSSSFPWWFGRFPSRRRWRGWNLISEGGVGGGGWCLWRERTKSGSGQPRRREFGEEWEEGRVLTDQRYRLYESHEASRIPRKLERRGWLHLPSRERFLLSDLTSSCNTAADESLSASTSSKELPSKRGTGKSDLQSKNGLHRREESWHVEGLEEDLSCHIPVLSRIQRCFC